MEAEDSAAAAAAAAERERARVRAEARAAADGAAAERDDLVRVVEHRSTALVLLIEWSRHHPATLRLKTRASKLTP
jgi:hypothetical protein